MKMHATLQCGRREYMSHPLCGAFCVEARVISETIFVGITLSLPFACVYRTCLCAFAIITSILLLLL